MTKRMKEFKKRIQGNTIGGLMSSPQTTDDDLAKCEEFFQKLQDILKDHYVVKGSCNNDISKYMIPVGTEDQVSYYGKPDFSFRISDHWNWYSNLKKCSDRNYIQCDSVDMPPAGERKDDRPTRPRKGLQVAIYLPDGKYHHVFGYKWDRDYWSFDWVESNPEDICRLYGLI